MPTTVVSDGVTTPRRPAPQAPRRSPTRRGLRPCRRMPPGAGRGGVAPAEARRRGVPPVGAVRGNVPATARQERNSVLAYLRLSSWQISYAAWGGRVEKGAMQHGSASHRAQCPFERRVDVQPAVP